MDWDFLKRTQAGGLGPFEVGAPLVIRFPAGIPGFEVCRRFVLIVSEEFAPLRCLQALDPPEPSFLTVDPTALIPGYDCTLRELERRRLGASGQDKLLWLVLLTMLDGVTANLCAPIVINPARMLGCQFIRGESDYPVRFQVCWPAESAQGSPRG
jgi:flagellar assembly factor FliW